MVLPHGKGDLAHKYRPLQFKEVVGHTAEMKSIRTAITAENPSQAFLLIGGSGTGKTTTARVIALSLNCESPLKDGDPCLECPSCKMILEGGCSDIMEMNAADTRGIDAARDLRSSMSLMPMYIKNKVYIIDEAQGLTKEAQETLLKVLEEAPSHVYIILCTTDPQQLKRTVKSRCQEFKFKPLKASEIKHLLVDVATFETYEVQDEVFDMIVDKAEGSPRNALMYLQQAAQIGFENDQDIKSFLATEKGIDGEVIKICFELGGSGNWEKIVKIYNECKSVGPQGIGMMIAGYFRNQLLKGKNPRKNAAILDLFVDPMPEGKVGENKLVLHLFKASQIR